MTHVVMRSTRKGREGTKVKTFEEGQIYDITDKGLVEVFLKQKWCDEIDESEIEKTATEVDLTSLDGKNLNELRRLAADKDISLRGITKKEDIIGAIKAALSGEVEDTEEDGGEDEGAETGLEEDNGSEEEIEDDEDGDEELTADK